MTAFNQNLWNFLLDVSRMRQSQQHPLCICAGFRKASNCPKCSQPPVEDKRPGRGVHVNTEADE